MANHRTEDARFIAGLANDIPPFTLPLGTWAPVPERASGGLLQWPMFLLNESGNRLCAFSEHAHLARMKAPCLGAQTRLLEQLATGGPEDPVEGNTDEIWRCLFAVVRSERFEDGNIARHALALVRIGNEIRRRLGEQIAVGRHPPHAVNAAHNGVIEAATAVRLPFDPPPWGRQFRSEVRLKLANLEPKPRHVLAGIYAAQEEEEHDVADTENVLFYNVGNAAFSRLSTVGLRFERSYEPMHEDAGAVFPLRHRHRYEMVPSDARLTHWKRGATLAQWDDAAVTGLSASMKATEVWWSLRRACVRSVGSNHVGIFGLRLVVHGFRERPLMGLLKPLFDGVIATFHAWNKHDPEEVVARLARQLAAPPAEVRALLLENPRAMLGARELVRPYREGVVWNPEDERCLVGELLSGDAAGPTRVSGELFALVARPRPFGGEEPAVLAMSDAGRT